MDNQTNDSPQASRIPQEEIDTNDKIQPIIDDLDNEQSSGEMADSGDFTKVKADMTNDEAHEPSPSYKGEMRSIETKMELETIPEEKEELEDKTPPPKTRHGPTDEEIHALAHSIVSMSISKAMKQELERLGILRDEFKESRSDNSQKEQVQPHTPAETGDCTQKARKEEFVFSVNAEVFYPRGYDPIAQHSYRQHLNNNNCGDYRLKMSHINSYHDRTHTEGSSTGSDGLEQTLEENSQDDTIDIIVLPDSTTTKSKDAKLDPVSEMVIRTLEMIPGNKTESAPVKPEFTPRPAYPHYTKWRPNTQYTPRPFHPRMNASQFYQPRNGRPFPRPQFTPHVPNYFQPPRQNFHQTQPTIQQSRPPVYMQMQIPQEPCCVHGVPQQAEMEDGIQYGYSQRGKAKRKAQRLSSRFATQAGKYHHHANFYVKSCAEDLILSKKNQR